jgi:AmiR/NasT family two-component response regulator
VKDSIVSFYTTARRTRFFAYAGFALIACCYIAVNSLLFHRAEREISYEVTWLLATMVAIAPIAYHFLRNASSNALATQPPTVRPLRLLLAEDQETATVLRILLKQAGWDVLAEASNPKEIIERTITLRPEVVFIDLEKVGSGLEIARQITRRIPSTRILIVSVSYIGVTTRISGGAAEIKIFDATRESTVQTVISRRMTNLTTQQFQITRLLEELDLPSAGAVVLYRDRKRS